MDNLIDLSSDVSVGAVTLPPCPILEPIAAESVPPQPPPIVNNFIPSKRNSMDNNPFDKALRQVSGFNDPFECVHNMAMQQSVNTIQENEAIATGSLIQLDMSETAGMESLADENVPPLPEPKSPRAKTNRTHSESDISSLLQSIKAKSPISNRSRSTSLDQLVRRNQLLKFSIANSSINVFSPRSTKTGTPERPLDAQDDSFDDLNATCPEWVESEADDSDIEQMYIPFLRNRCPDQVDQPPVVEPQPLTQKNIQTERDQLFGHIERHKSIPSPPTMPVVIEEDLGATATTIPEIQVSSPTERKREELATLLASVKQAIEKFDNHSEAKAMLANFNSALGISSEPTESEHVVTPTPIIRQGTFNLEDTSPGSSSVAASENLSSVEVSPNTTNVANVVEQLGLMNLNQQFSVLQNLNNLMVPNAAGPVAMAPNTYIVVMNTPAAKSARSHDSDDDESPSSYLKTRKSRSHSLNLQSKPTAVAKALAAKAALRGHVNANTPIRATNRRSSFSNTLAPPAAVPAGSPRLHIKRSPGRLPKSPSKLNSYAARRATISGRPKPSSTSTPILLKPSTTATSQPLKLRVSGEMARPSKPVPMRATIPIKSVAPIKRETVAPIATPSVRSLPTAAAVGTPRRQTGLQRPTASYVSATPGAKRLNAMSGSMATAAAARRRTMSEGVHETVVKPTYSAGGSGLPRFTTTPMKRLSTLPTKFGTTNKENKAPK